MEDNQTIKEKTLERALSFLLLVEHEFSNQPEVYDDLVNAVSEHRSKRLDHREIPQQVEKFFRDHRELYLRFKAILLPHEERIDPHQIDPISNPCSSSDWTGTSPTHMESSLQATPKSPIASSSEELKKNFFSFPERVRWEFRNQPEAYEKYLSLTKEMSKECHESYAFARMVRLFHDHSPRLFDALNEHLPPLYRIKVENDEKMNPVLGVKFGLTERSRTLLKMMRQGIITGRELSDALSFIDKVRSELRNQPAVFNDFLSATQELYPESENTPEILRRVSNLLRGHPELIAGYNEFLPPRYKIRVENDHEMQVVDDDSSLSGATGTSLTHSQQTQQATANSPTASSSAAAEPPAENRSILVDTELLQF